MSFLHSFGNSWWRLRPRETPVCSDAASNSPEIAKTDVEYFEAASEFVEVASDGANFPCLTCDNTPSRERANGGLILALPDSLVEKELWPLLAASPEMQFKLRSSGEIWWSLLSSSTFCTSFSVLRD